MTPMKTSDSDPTQALADFAAGLAFEAIPEPVLRRAEDLFLDWFASALAGKGARPVETIARGRSRRRTRKARRELRSRLEMLRLVGP